MSPDLFPPLSHRLELAFVQCFAAFVRVLPPWSLRWAGWFLGLLAYGVMGRRRQVSLRNLRLVFPGRREREIRSIGRRSFVRLARTLLESVGGALLSKEGGLHGVEVHGLEELENAVAGKNGVVLVAGHLGNWELLGAATAGLGYRHLCVSKPLKNRSLDHWLKERRAAVGIDVIPSVPSSIWRLMDHLESGGIVSLVTDQDARSKGVGVRFLGQPASAHRGAATLALAIGCPIVVGTIVRNDSGRGHKIRYRKQRMPEVTGDTEVDVQRVTQGFMELLEDSILEHPEDYLWAHNRFKTRMAPKSSQTEMT